MRAYATWGAVVIGSCLTAVFVNVVSVRATATVLVLIGMAGLLRALVSHFRPPWRDTLQARRFEGVHIEEWLRGYDMMCSTEGIEHVYDGPWLRKRCTVCGMPRRWPTQVAP